VSNYNSFSLKNKMKNKKLAYLYLIITFCAWGSLYVVGKFVMGKVPVFMISSVRYIIAGIILFFIMKKMKPKKIEKQDYKYIFLIGFVGYFIATVAQLIGVKFSNASLASLVNSVNPIAIMLFAAIILKEKLTLKKVICIILAVVGVHTIIGGSNESGELIGILISLFAVISWSIVSVIVRRVTQKYDPIQITTYGIIIAAISTLPFSIGEFVITPNIQIDWTVVISLIYIGVVCTALAHFTWNKSLSMIEAGSCSLFYPIQPMMSVFLGWLFLGESININFVIGAGLIIVGVLISVIHNKDVEVDNKIQTKIQ